MSSAIFRALQKPRGVGGDDSVGWVLRVGGVAALAAAYMTTRIGEESEGGSALGDEEEGGLGFAAVGGRGAGQDEEEDV